MPLRMPAIFRLRTWVPAACLIIFAALLLSCAGGRGRSDSPYAGRDLSGRTLLIPGIDTSVIAIDPISDIVDGIPSNGRILAPRPLLAERVRDRLAESLRFHLNRSGLRIEQADSLFDTAAARDSAAPILPAAAMPRPDFILKFTSLESRRKATTELMPKIGIITRNPLHFAGEYLLWDVIGDSTVTRGRFRTYVTGGMGIGPATWANAIDDAAGQVAKGLPFRKK